MQVAGVVTTLVLTAHGSADPRSAANTREIAGLLSGLRPGLDVRVAFLERNAPTLGDVLAGLSGAREAVVTPLLLADAYHARIDIPGQIARSGAARNGIDVRQAGVLGEDDRLVSVLRDRLAWLGVSRVDHALGVLVVAIGSSDAAANARTAAVAAKLAAETRWAGAATAFATRPEPSLAEAASQLRRRSARRLVIAPWFLAPGRLTDRVWAYARDAGIPIAPPLGAHRLVAATVLERFDQAIANRMVA
jgi:sirohydrochlorin ferrochelatase